MLKWVCITLNMICEYTCAYNCAKLRIYIVNFLYTFVHVIYARKRENEIGVKEFIFF